MLYPPLEQEILSNVEIYFGGLINMGRGKHFNHKQKGHEPKIPARGFKAESKGTTKVEFAIEPVARDGHKPVYLKEEDDL